MCPIKVIRKVNSLEVKQTIFSKVFLDFPLKKHFLHILGNNTSASFKSGASLWPSKFEEPLHAVSSLEDSHTREHGKDSTIETCIFSSSHFP